MLVGLIYKIKKKLFGPKNKCCNYIKKQKVQNALVLTTKFFGFVQIEVNVFTFKLRVVFISPVVFTFVTFASSTV